MFLLPAFVICLVIGLYLGHYHDKMANLHAAFFICVAGLVCAPFAGFLFLKVFFFYILFSMLICYFNFIEEISRHNIATIFLFLFITLVMRIFIFYDLTIRNITVIALCHESNDDVTSIATRRSNTYIAMNWNLLQY